jgi:hypothetical protein
MARLGWETRCCAWTSVAQAPDAFISAAARLAFRGGHARALTWDWQVWCVVGIGCQKLDPGMAVRMVNGSRDDITRKVTEKLFCKLGS